MSEPDYRGMTVNERLFAAGLLDKFDQAMNQGDRAALEVMLGQVEVDPNLATTLLGEGYECWLCGEAIDRRNIDALRVTIELLWTEDADNPSQEIYAHFSCAQSRMMGAKMSLEADTFAVEAPGD